jgi:hypothetical protein
MIVAGRTNSAVEAVAKDISLSGATPFASLQMPSVKPKSQRYPKAPAQTLSWAFYNAGNNAPERIVDGRAIF